MAVAVLAYPEMAAEGYDRIQAIRRDYDPAVSFVEPHFTIVFPREDIDAGSLIAHAGPLAAGLKPVRFTLARAETARGVSDGMSYLYLVPDEGHDAIVDIHGRLHAGPVRHRPGVDPAFVPHITVGVFGDPDETLSQAMRLNGEGLKIHGRLAALSVVACGDATVTPLANIPLGAN
jgi:2'-5' RNA ligase